MRALRTLGEILSIFSLLAIMLAGLFFPVFSSNCEAGGDCNLYSVEDARAYTPRRIYLVSASDCPSSFEERVILLINVERANAGVAPLTLDIRLQDAARWFADDISKNGVQLIPHNDSRGQPPEYRVQVERGYDFDWLGETVIVGSGIDNDVSTPEGVVRGWMKSPSHHDILLSPNFEHLGVGYVHTHDLIWDDVTVADFASPLDSVETREPPFDYCDPGFYQMTFPIVMK